MRDHREQNDLIAFVAPGFVHALGNSLFAIHGQAQLIREVQGETGRARAQLLKASRKALDGLDILRFLLGDTPTGESAQAGVLLYRLCDFLRVPLRERGLRLKFRHGSSEAPQIVDGVAMCRSVVHLAAALIERLPTGFEGSWVVDLAGQGAGEVQLTFTLRNDEALLPFPIELEEIADAVRPELEEYRVRAERTGKTTLRLRIPATTVEPGPAASGLAQ